MSRTHLKKERVSDKYIHTHTNTGYNIILKEKRKFDKNSSKGKSSNKSLTNTDVNGGGGVT